MNKIKLLIGIIIGLVIAGGTANDTSHGPANSNNSGYWTMCASSSNTNAAWVVSRNGSVFNGNIDYTLYSARAVVVVNK